MYGIDLNEPIIYYHSSPRFFAEGEHHVSRICAEDVLLFITDGALRFSEDGEEIEVRAGEYYIQRRGLSQVGRLPSDSPSYLYIHFKGEWRESGITLPRQGKYDSAALSVAQRLAQTSYTGATLTERCALFFKLLTALAHEPKNATLGARIAEYIRENYKSKLTLSSLSQKFSYSKNHIINSFKTEHGMTPFEYINRIRLEKAEQLLESYSTPISCIIYDCGFSDYAYFYKLFFRKNGISPTKWRRRKQKAPTPS